MQSIPPIFGYLQKGQANVAVIIDIICNFPEKQSMIRVSERINSKKDVNRIMGSHTN